MRCCAAIVNYPDIGSFRIEDGTPSRDTPLGEEYYRIIYKKQGFERDTPNTLPILIFKQYIETVACRGIMSSWQAAYVNLGEKRICNVTIDVRLKKI